jgi:hypothetical protein
MPRALLLLSLMLNALAFANSEQGSPENEMSLCSSNLEVVPPQSQSFLSNPSPLYRRLQSMLMREAGYKKALSLLHHHRKLIPAEPAILEIGPFDNPLAQEITGGRYVYWEYDSEAAANLIKANRGKDSVKVLQTDLNALNEEAWARLEKSSLESVKRAEGSSRGFDLIILSSVLNYVDPVRVLRSAFEMLSSGGFLVIANSNIGTNKVLSRSFFPYPVSETLFSSHAGHFRFLAGSEIETIIRPGLVIESFFLRKVPADYSDSRRRQLFEGLVHLYLAGLKEEEPAPPPSPGFLKGAWARLTGASRLPAPLAPLPRVESSQITKYAWQRAVFLRGFAEKKDLFSPEAPLFLPDRPLLRAAQATEDSEEFYIAIANALHLMASSNEVIRAQFELPALLEQVREAIRRALVDP